MSARTSVSTPTSAGKNAARPRSASMSRSVSRPPRSSMSERTTKAPSRASRFAIARPEPPPPAPVTIATLPLSSMLYPLASLAYYDPRLKHRSAIRVFPFGLRSSGRADLSLRRRGEDQPCDQGGVFLVLSPGRADGRPQLGDAAPQLVDGEPELERAARVQLALRHSRDAQVAAFAGMAECVAEKLALRRVNQRVRGERRRKRCRWTTRAEEDAASHDVMALPSQIVNDRAEGSSGSLGHCGLLNPLPRSRPGLGEAPPHDPDSLVPALDSVAFRGGGRLYPDSIRPALMCPAESPVWDFWAMSPVARPLPVTARLCNPTGQPFEERSSGRMTQPARLFFIVGCMYYSAEEAAAVKHHAWSV